MRFFSSLHQSFVRLFSAALMGTMQWMNLIQWYTQQLILRTNTRIRIEESNRMELFIRCYYRINLFFGFSLKIQRHHLNMHFLILLLVNNLKTFTHIKCISLWLCWRILHNFDGLPLLILLYLLSIIIIQMTDDKQLQCLLQHWIQMTLFNKSNVKLH